tara:strand:+ start:428 stop:829 length:402 start_codon:yes stop_codon:yes gene_type:complete
MNTEKEIKQAEAKRVYNKKYYEANRDKIVARAKAHYQNNREALIERQLTYHRSHNLHCTIVYMIPNYDGLGNDYVGITRNLNNRLANHRYLGKLNVDKWDILDVEYDKDKARELERDFHTQGYHGGRQKKSTN